LTEFVFMLTRNDVTVPNALEILEAVKETGLRFVGCKNIGLDFDQYQELFARMKNYGMRSFLEVVTYSEKEHFNGVDLALQIGANYLIGGMPQFTEKTMEYIRKEKSGPKYFPYIGDVVDHPCVLQGSIDQLIEDGKQAEKLGVDGVNLLLYRYKGKQTALLDKVVEKMKVPVIVAGNVRNFEQINELKRRNIWGFTIGGAIFEGNFDIKKSVKEQIQAVLNRV
jgi:Histidine biosynthesis protein